MDIAILQRELDELRRNPVLLDEYNFRVRKEALDFIDVIQEFRPEQNMALIRLQEQARILEKQLRALNQSLAQNFYHRLKSERPTLQELRTWLQPYTDFVPRIWGKPHHGYESLDFLLDEILLPQPHPTPSLPPKYGMVRYEPTPASVLLELTERILFTDNDVFYDFGSGLGKVTSLVHLLSGVRCVGVEYQPSFCAYAESQAYDLNLGGVTYLNADARDVDYGEGTVFFLFNPFGGMIFDAVLEKLRLEAEKREIWICSYGSASQPLSELSWLERVPPLGGDEMALAIFRRRD